MEEEQPHWLILPEHIAVAEDRPLGTGGFGTVYRGVWEGANVAVKRLAEETSDHHGNINQYLAKTEPPGYERSRLIREIALGMQYLHGRKIVHGDLKPGNILVSDNLQACIADFGLSEMRLGINERSSIGGNHRDVAGSPRYFSPEAWKGQTSFASDVFAFSMTAFEASSQSQSCLA
ncbi:Tyrosine kinase domain protein [Ceratobasidium sp. AG-Ba]|nr:Tyrosine kinase domain protein [Ceratobasidium sp. AG-Ba]